MNKLPLENPEIAARFRAAGKPAPQRLPLENPEIAARFRAAKQENPAPRRARATWGPTNVTTGAPLAYAPRWKTDHHPWIVDGGSIRYAGHEVEEVSAPDAP